MVKIKLGALISGSGTNLQAIIDACQSGTISATLSFVGSDRPDATGLARAERAGIETFVVDYDADRRRYEADPTSMPLPEDCDLKRIIAKQTLLPKSTGAEKLKRFFAARVVSEARLLDKMGTQQFDLLVLAGFMRTLTPYIIDRVNREPDRPRIMNIHPALLPSFPGTDGYGDTFRYGCKIGGCSVHFVDYGEDSGPIIGQKAFGITADDTLETIREKGLALEWQLYPECIQLYAQDRLRIASQAGGRKTVKILPEKNPT